MKISMNLLDISILTLSQSVKAKLIEIFTKVKYFVDDQLRQIILIEKN